MRFHLQENRANFKNKYQSGLASQIWVPLNAGRYVGTDNQSGLFKNRPDTDSIKLTDWVSNQITLGNVTFSSLNTPGDLTFTETVDAYETNSSLALKSITVTHEISGGATEEIPVNVPVGALLKGASIIAATDLAFTTGTEVDVTLTTEGSTIASAVASKNDKGSIMVVPSLVAGTPETITLTADAGTVDSGTVIATIWYEEVSDYTDIA